MMDTYILLHRFPGKISLVLFLLSLLWPGIAVAASGNPAAVDGEPSRPCYAMVVEYDVPVTLRDGTTVAVDIYRPKASGRFPVLLEGSAYDKRCSTDIRMSTHTFFVPRGYVVIIWNVRGRFKSGGSFDMAALPGNDGWDMVEWAARQPWSNGKIGLVGKSYSGQILLHTAAARPPHLICAMSALTGSDAWQWYYRGGAMEFGFSLYWGTVILGWDLAEKTLGNTPALQRWKNLLEMYLADQQTFADVIPLLDFKPAQIAPGVNLFATWASHPTADAYWKRLSPSSYFSRIEIPILHIGGWYDIFLDGTLNAFQELRQRAGAPLARRNQRLLLGPWHHSVPSYHGTRIGSVDYGPGLNQPGFNMMRLAFADYWLKDTRTPLYREDAPVSVFTMGRNCWRTAPSWPPAEAEPQVWYFHASARRKGDSLNDGALSQAGPAPAAPPQTYLYDPMNPTPTRGGSGLLLFPFGPDSLVDYGQQEQGPVDKRSLTFTSEPLVHDLLVSGAVSAHLSASSSAVDTDWVVRLCDVFPDGRSLNVVEGIQRARFRESASAPSLLQPGHIYDYTVRMSATEYLFRAGHRLRITVGSSSYPRWSRNLNVAAFPEQAVEWTVARNAIHVDAAHPSWVELPILSADAVACRHGKDAAPSGERGALPMEAMPCPKPGGSEYPR